MIRPTIAAVTFCLLASSLPAQQAAQPFGSKFPNLDGRATGEWWQKAAARRRQLENGNQRQRNNATRFIEMDVPRDEVVAFAVYTHDRGVLKLTAQLFPLKPGEPMETRLEFKRNGKWEEAGREKVWYPGWSSHFRIEKWDNTKEVPYRVRHGESAMFEGLIRHDPIEKDVITVGNLSCNSSRTGGRRPKIVENLKKQNPDLLFFAGDQTYHHTEHTAGWLQFGLQFREILRDRPTITIPDDHDVGQANVWGENGKVAKTPQGPTGGYYYPADYVNMVQRHQTWHLPDPYDGTPIERGITVYYTNLRVGGVDFAILEDRKFKSGPEGKIPKMGPRPDHINDPKYDRKSVDVAGLKLMGDRQLKFLDAWSQDWTGAELKVALSQTAFCGAVHLHGSPKNRLLADLDSNAWPQTGRNKAVAAIRRAWAPHLCGDQHLAVVVKHGVNSRGDGPFAFTSPAIVNTIYGRWWHPEDEKPGANAVPNSPLPWTGDYLDGLGNHIRMLAYANPEDRSDETKRSDGYGMVMFDKKNQTGRFECWHRFADLSKGNAGQFPGWPVTFRFRENDGRKVVGKLPGVSIDGVDRPVVQVESKRTGEVLYTVRVKAGEPLPVYAKGTYTIHVGRDKPSKIGVDYTVD